MHTLSAAATNALREGLFKVVTLYRKDRPKLWSKLVGSHVFTDNQKYAEFAQHGDFGLGAEIPEGTGVPIDDFFTGNVTQIAHVMRGLGFILSYQSEHVDPYGVIKRKGEKMALAMDQTKETIAANIFALMADSSTTGADGVPLLSTAHPLDAGVAANTGSVGLALGTANLEYAVQQFRRQKSHRGNVAAAMGPFRLHVTPEREFVAKRITGLTERYPEDDRGAPNPVAGMISEVVASPYYPVGYSWALQSTDDEEHGLYLMNRMARFTKDKDMPEVFGHFFATGEEVTSGFTDWRGWWGTTGLA